MFFFHYHVTLQGCKPCHVFSDFTPCAKEFGFEGEVLNGGALQAVDQWEWHGECRVALITHMGVSQNRGTPKSSILIGFSLINHPFWGTTIFPYKNPWNWYIWYRYTCMTGWFLLGKLVGWNIPSETHWYSAILLGAPVHPIYNWFLGPPCVLLCYHPCMVHPRKVTGWNLKIPSSNKRETSTNLQFFSVVPAFSLQGCR